MMAQKAGFGLHSPDLQMGPWHFRVAMAMQNVPTLRIELRTFSLRNRRSTTELNRLFEQDWRVVKIDFLQVPFTSCPAPRTAWGSFDHDRSFAGEGLQVGPAPTRAVDAADELHQECLARTAAAYWVLQQWRDDPT